MKPCDRRWEVEALRDQRLGESDRTRVQRHIAGCSDCSREQQEFEQLGAALAALPAVSVDELTLRRRRAAVLARAYAESVDATPRKTRWLAAALVAGGVAASLTLWRFTATPAPAGAPISAGQRSTPEVLITADVGARYTREESANGTLVQLMVGRITLDVRGVSHHQGVVVRTPDGEVIDQGTVFAVTVQDDQTRGVEVRQGSVVVRLRGREQHTVRAGEQYAPYERDEPTAPAESAPSVVTPPASTARRHPHAEKSRSVAPTSELDGSISDREFEAAMSALNQGRLRESSEGFGQFLERYPRDGRAEDASFLQIVALKRNHRDPEVQTAARAYLARFPRGLRVREVNALIKAP